MKVLFIDESGDHNLLVIDSHYPVFVLGGVIMEEDYAKGAFTDDLNEFKLRMLGSTEIVLHTADIVRNRKGFEQMKDDNFRNHFNYELNALIRRANFHILAVTINKLEHKANYGLAALDPYILALEVLIERFCEDVGSVDKGGDIVVEKRNKELDRNISLAWQNIKIRGTRFTKAEVVNKRINDLHLCSKSENIAGLQLADLIVSPIGRHILGKPGKKDWRIVESKFGRDKNGQVKDFGLVCLPRH